MKPVGFLKIFLAPCLALGLASFLAAPAFAGEPGSTALRTPASALGCYRAADKVGCFLDKAAARFDQVKDVGERADAAAELLYTAAVLGAENDPLLQQTMAIAATPELAAYREMALLYAIDLYHYSLQSPLADTAYAAATSRFAALESSLQGHGLLDLYVGACSMLSWEDDFLSRWGEFLADNCTEEKLLALDLDKGYDRVWLVAMLPVASTVAGDRDSYVRNAGAELAWLEQARKTSERSKIPAERNFINVMGAVMQSLNATALEIFEQPDSAKSALDQSLQYLRRLERQDGISSATTPLRRSLVEALYKAGRDKEAKTLLQQMLKRIDSDAKGRHVSLAEQVAILALAANMADFVESGGASAAPAAETKEI
jgi:hypothetical protein